MAYKKKFPFFTDLEQQDKTARKAEAYKALHDAYKKAEAGEWEKVIKLGLQFPENMDDIIKAYYSDMPDDIRYTLPVKWYLVNKASDTVCSAIKNALQYKPSDWIGKNDIKGDIIDVFCCLKHGNKEDAKNCLSWATNHGSCYIDAMKIAGVIFKASISKDNIIAFDKDSCTPVIQFRSVYAVQQDFPVLPLAALKRSSDYDYYGTETDPETY